MLTPAGCPAISYCICIVPVPVAVTWNVFAVPYTADVLFAEVIVGAVAAAAKVVNVTEITFESPAEFVATI